MVDISIETPEQTDRRLLTIIRNADFRVMAGRFCFSEFELAAFPGAVHAEALALIKDENGWSQLAPCSGEDGEAFALFSFHFPDGADNSGFVGWLATRLKQRFGTGVFVVCGYNASRGGVFDYWGCPAVLANDVIAEVRHMHEGADGSS